MKLSTSLTFPLSSTNTEEVRKWAQLYLPVGSYDQKTGKNKPTQPPGKPENPGGNGNHGGNQGGGNGGGGGSSGPPGQSFSATPLFYAPFQTTLVPTIAAAGTPNYAVANSRGTVRDWENNLRRVKTGEARFTGARRVENLVAGSSENFANVSWLMQNSGTAGAVSPTPTGNFATDPLGGSTASRLQTNLGSDPAGGYSRALQTFTFPTSTGIRTTRVSVWMKSNSGTPTVAIQAISGNTSFSSSTVSVTLGSSWVRYTTGICTSGSTADQLAYIVIGSLGTGQGGVGNSATADILVWGAQLENVSGQSNQLPGDYVSVGVLSSPYHGAFVDGVKYFNYQNGNTVASNIVTNGVGAGIASNTGGSQYTTDLLGPFGLLIEQNQNNTGNVSAETAFNATYTTKTNLTVTDLNASSPMGETTAAALVENGINGDHRLGQFGAVASNTKLCMSCFVKPNTRTQIRLRGDPDGANFCDGEFSLVGSGSVLAVTPHGTATIQGSGVDVYANGWYRVWFIATYASTAGGFSYSYYPMVSQSSTYTGTNGTTAMWLWGSLVSSVQETDLTSPPSYSWDARGVDQLSYTFAGNADGTVGTAYAECYSKWSTPGADRFIVSFDAAANNQNPLIVSSGDAATTVRVRDGTNNVQKTGLSSMATAFRKNASSWATTGSTLRVTGGGATPASGSFDGNIGSTAIGIGMATTYSGSNFQGHIRNVKIYNVAADANQLASITT